MDPQIQLRLFIHTLYLKHDSRDSGNLNCKINSQMLAHLSINKKTIKKMVQLVKLCLERLNQ